MFLANIPLNIDWQQILLHLLNFVILVGGLYFILFNPVKKFMDKRKAHYEEMDKKAVDTLSSVKDKEREINEKLANLNQELENKKVAASKEISSLKEAQLAEAQKQAEEIVSKATIAAEKEKEKIITSANKEIRNLVSEGMKKVMSSSEDEAIDDFVKTFEGSKKDGSN